MDIKIPNPELIEFYKWLEETFPDTYAIKDTHGVRDWITFAYVVWRDGRDLALKNL